MPAHKPLPLPIHLLHQVQGVFNHLALSLRLLNLRRYLKLLSQLMTRVNYRKLGKCNYRLQFTSYLFNFNRSVDDEMVSVPPAQQKTYLVFESALLLLFNLCIYCGSTSTQIRKIVTGTFLRITQKCMKCSRVRVWDSQPYVGRTPAGNIRLSAAILFVGALPAQALRIFRTLNCPTISKKAFFRHQAHILQPAISSIWTTQQEYLIAQFRDHKKPLQLAGDGRADSPGHSAKYGSYSVIDLTCNKVLDFKLVQVYQFRTLNHNDIVVSLRAMKWVVVITWRKKVFTES